MRRTHNHNKGKKILPKTNYFSLDSKNIYLKQKIRMSILFQIISLFKIVEPRGVAKLFF